MSKLKITDDGSDDGTIDQLKKYLLEQLIHEQALVPMYERFSAWAGSAGAMARQQIADVKRFERQVIGWRARIEELEASK